MLRSVDINLQENVITFRYQGSDDIIYKTQINSFQENTGLTIANPSTDIPAYALQLNQFGTDIKCGHIVENIVAFLKSINMDNILLIIDFQGVISISQSFAEEYIKFILSTKSKVISINQNTNINNGLSRYVESIIDIQEVTQ